MLPRPRRCSRCQGSIIEQHFTEIYGRGMLLSCIACGEEIEQLDGEQLMPPAELRRIFAASAAATRRGRPKKAS
jgi:hypothetical protein